MTLANVQGINVVRRNISGLRDAVLSFPRLSVLVVADPLLRRCRLGCRNEEKRYANED